MPAPSPEVLAQLWAAPQGVRDLFWGVGGAKLDIKADKDTDDMRPAFEKILASYNLTFELRSASGDEVTYEVQVPLEVHLDDVSDRLLKLDPLGHLAVDWDEKKNKK